MGGTTSHTYGGFIGEKKEGETQILRDKNFLDKDLLSEPEPGINTIFKAFEQSCQKFSKNNFLGTRKKLNKTQYSQYQWKSFSEVFSIVENFCDGLINLELCKEVKSGSSPCTKLLGIYSRNREEWVISDLACQMDSITVVTLYDSLGDDAIEFILEQTEIATLALESINLKKIIKIKKSNKAKSLKNIILFDFEDEKSLKEAVEIGLIIQFFDDIVSTGKTRKNIKSPSNPETIATICYTSGTTGNPKGAMISNRCILADLSALNNSDVHLDENDVHLSYLPLAHIMERVLLSVCIYKGMSIGFYTGTPTNIVNDAMELKPTTFVGVPKVFQRIYDTLVDRISNTFLIKRALINRTISVKLGTYKSSGYLFHSVYDRLICNRFKDALGGRVKVMLTGSAPISQETLDFLKVLFCCPILEGYGQTECCGATITAVADFQGGSVGGPVSGAEIKLVDCKDLNYLTTDTTDGIPTPRGEVCIRGPVLFSGYFKDPEKTRESIDDEGWLHTGDIGMILPNFSLKLIDRKKNIFKLSQGEYIAPEKLENVLCKGFCVQQIFVDGNSHESYLIAIIVPRKDQVVSFLNSMSIACDKENAKDFYNNELLIKTILSDLEKLSRENGFKGFEIVKKIYLTDLEFTVENDLLTPTMKIKRHQLKKKFLNIIDKLYSEK